MSFSVCKMYKVRLKLSISTEKMLTESYYLDLKKKNLKLSFSAVHVG